MKTCARYNSLYQVVAILLCLVMSPLPALAQATPGTSSSSSTQPAGQISAVVPQATRNGQTARTRDDVMWNDVIKTEGGGRARVTLRDGSILSVGSNSELQVIQHDANTQQTQLQLNYGRVRSRVVQLTKPGAKFEVKTATAVAGVIGTDFIVIFVGGRMQVICFSGQVVIVGANGAVLATVNAGQMVEVNADGSVNGPNQTPDGVQQDAINETNAAGGEGGAAGGGGSLLRTVLIFLGVAAASAIVTTLTTGDRGGTPPPTPTTTFCTFCDQAGRPRR